MRVCRLQNCYIINNNRYRWLPTNTWQEPAGARRGVGGSISNYVQTITFLIRQILDWALSSTWWLLISYNVVKYAVSIDQFLFDILLISCSTTDFFKNPLRNYVGFFLNRNKFALVYFVYFILLTSLKILRMFLTSMKFHCSHGNINAYLTSHKIFTQFRQFFRVNSVLTFVFNVCFVQCLLEKRKLLRLSQSSK